MSANQHEQVTLHSLMQGVRVNEFEWLCGEQQCRVPASEAAKRGELATQFVHWLFDSYLIPLLQVRVQSCLLLTHQATFYATETAATRYGTVYYPHAAWASAAVPHLEHLAETLLEELTAVSRVNSHR